MRTCTDHRDAPRPLSTSRDDRRPRLVARSAQAMVVVAVLLFCAWCVGVLAELAEPGNPSAPAALGVLIAGTLAVSVVLLVALEVVIWYAARVNELGIRTRYDALTGALAREPVVALARSEVVRAHRTASPVALVMVDADDFKAVNDRHGHRAGDAVLARLVERMKASLRSYDAIGRYGGDEFLVVLPGCGLQETREVCRRLVEACHRPVEHKGAVIQPTVSVGAAVDIDGTATFEDLLDQADQLLYRAKEAGRNAYRVDLKVAS